MDCHDCFHWEVCAYVNPDLPTCDSFSPYPPYNTYYENLKKQGRLLVLPCKIGTRIYRIVPDFSVVWPDPPKNKVIWDTFKIQDIYEFGKTVFLTREEAQAICNKK